MARPVEGSPELVAYLKPSHARPERDPVMVKRLSSPRGIVPPQLAPYVEAIKEVKSRERR